MKLANRSVLVAVAYLLVSFSPDISDKEKNIALETASKYAITLKRFSGCGNPSEADQLRVELNLLFGSPEDSFKYILDVPHANDLLKNESSHSFDQYLNYIEDNYKYHISIDFSKSEFLSCIDNIDGKKIAYIGMNKTLSYENNKNTVYIIIAIALSGEQSQIVQVFFPREYNRSNSCSFTDTRDDKESSDKYIVLGDSLFDHKNYIDAKAAYGQAIAYGAGHSINRKIQTCVSMIDLDQEMTHANELYLRGDYFNARDAYIRLRDQYPKQRLYAVSRTLECEHNISEIKYNEYKKAGDEYFEQQFWSKAVATYEVCYLYRPNDAYVRDKIYQCRAKDESTAQEMARDAIYLAENKNRKAEAFKQLYEAEPSGVLTGQNYYFMAMMMDGRYAHVDRLMGFSKNQCYHLAIIYCRKAIRLGSADAEAMWQNELILKNIYK